MTQAYFSPLGLRVGPPTPARATHRLSLHAGDWVEVRPLDEVLATLDDQGCLDAMPFMAEMARFCGQRFQVFKTAHKSCDTIYTFTGRRLEDTVHLAGLRCDGGFHGGCQAGCLLFWKEAWLRRVDAPRMGAAAAPAPDPAAGESETLSGHVANLARQARRDDPQGGEPRYRCQATELLRASTPLRVFDPRHYVRDLLAGNITWWALLRTVALALFNMQQKLRGARGYPFLAGDGQGDQPGERLDLQPGELVQVRSLAEIRATLDGSGSNRGLSFDAEMAPYCGRTLRVLRRVDRILDEKTGKMLRLRKDCIILEGMVCSGLHCGLHRLGCPRSVYAYWREAWLRRVEGPGAATSAPATCGGSVEGKQEPSA